MARGSSASSNGGRSSSPDPSISRRGSSPPTSPGSDQGNKRSHNGGDGDDEDPDNESPQPIKKKKKLAVALSAEDKNTCVAAGRKIGRFVDMYCDMETLVHTAVSTDMNAPRELHSEAVNQHLDTFAKLLAIEPEISALLQRGMYMVPLVTAAIDSGRRKARSEDIATFKKSYRDWPGVCPLPMPFNQKKGNFGFHDEECGRRLCPGILDWYDLNIREQLANGEIQPEPADLSLGLWSNCVVDLTNLLDGFLQNEEDIICMRGIFLGPSIPQGEDKSKRKGHAANAGIRKVTFPMIAHIATMRRHILSEEDQFKPDCTGPGAFNYPRYYRQILKLADTLGPLRQKELLEWWNEKVFGNRHGLDDSDDKPSATTKKATRPNGLSLAQMVGQIAKVQAEEDERREAEKKKLEEEKKQAELARLKAERKERRRADRRARKEQEQQQSASGDAARSQEDLDARTESNGGDDQGAGPEM